MDFRPGTPRAEPPSARVQAGSTASAIDGIRAPRPIGVIAVTRRTLGQGLAGAGCEAPDPSVGACRGAQPRETIMAELNQADVREVQSIAAQALVGDDVTMDAEAFAGVDLGDIKEFFCQNWPTIKKVLQFLADTVGGIVKVAARALIAAGDFLHDRICGG
jgi:hypothetical protein